MKVADEMIDRFWDDLLEGPQYGVIRAGYERSRHALEAALSGELLTAEERKSVEIIRESIRAVGWPRTAKELIAIIDRLAPPQEKP